MKLEAKDPEELFKFPFAELDFTQQLALHQVVIDRCQDAYNLHNDLEFPEVQHLEEGYRQISDLEEEVADELSKLESIKDEESHKADRLATYNPSNNLDNTKGLQHGRALKQYKELVEERESNSSFTIARNRHWMMYGQTLTTIN